MKPRIVPDTATSVPERKDSHVGQHKRPAILSPSWSAGLLRTLVLFPHTWVKYAVWIVGLLVQVVLLVLAWYLVQVVADIAELWLALARKHLELTL